MRFSSAAHRRMKCSGLSCAGGWVLGGEDEGGLEIGGSATDELPPPHEETTGATSRAAR
ncbi:hypothetical protein [Nocardioides cynanchi]|uniref:hypothetical protein n=1 Tax=Nocardioides cynanchi TaxID=2558918 RepID=UPI001782ED4F|nr:hypothetical protein [Nocardioides cynanchi]